MAYVADPACDYDWSTYCRTDPWMFNETCYLDNAAAYTTENDALKIYKATWKTGVCDKRNSGWDMMHVRAFNLAIS